MIGKIIDTYQDYPSVIAFKLSVMQNSKFEPHATTQDRNKIIDSLSSEKAIGNKDIGHFCKYRKYRLYRTYL